MGTHVWVLRCAGYAAWYVFYIAIVCKWYWNYIPVTNVLDITFLLFVVIVNVNCIGFTFELHCIHIFRGFKFDANLNFMPILGFKFDANILHWIYIQMQFDLLFF